MRTDITSLTCADNVRNIVDTAVRVKYAPANVKQLLVTTSSNKLLKFDAWNGKILAEVSFWVDDDKALLQTIYDQAILILTVVWLQFKAVHIIIPLFDTVSMAFIISSLSDC